MLPAGYQGTGGLPGRRDTCRAGTCRVLRWKLDRASPAPPEVCPSRPSAPTRVADGHARPSPGTDSASWVTTTMWCPLRVHSLQRVQHLVAAGRVQLRVGSSTATAPDRRRYPRSAAVAGRRAPAHRLRPASPASPTRFEDAVRVVSSIRTWRRPPLGSQMLRCSVVYPEQVARRTLEHTPISVPPPPGRSPRRTTCHCHRCDVDPPGTRRIKPGAARSASTWPSRTADSAKHLPGLTTSTPRGHPRHRRRPGRLCTPADTPRPVPLTASPIRSARHRIMSAA